MWLIWINGSFFEMLGLTDFPYVNRQIIYLIWGRGKHLLLLLVALLPLVLFLLNFSISPRLGIKQVGHWGFNWDPRSVVVLWNIKWSDLTPKFWFCLTWHIYNIMTVCQCLGVNTWVVNRVWCYLVAGVFDTVLSDKHNFWMKVDIEKELYFWRRKYPREL